MKHAMTTRALRLLFFVVMAHQVAEAHVAVTGKVVAGDTGEPIPDIAEIM